MSFVVDKLSGLPFFMAVFIQTHAKMGSLKFNFPEPLSTNRLLIEEIPEMFEKVHSIQHKGFQPPITELPFDIYRGSPIITEYERTLANVCTSEFMSRFGRPL
jgi:hypothetical protein